jgi:hypothetical protein
MPLINIADIETFVSSTPKELRIRGIRGCAFSSLSKIEKNIDRKAYPTLNENYGPEIMRFDHHYQHDQQIS